MSFRQLLIASTPMLAAIEPRGRRQAHDVREFSFGYDQPKTTGYGFAGEVFELRKLRTVLIIWRWCRQGTGKPSAGWRAVLSQGRGVSAGQMFSQRAHHNSATPAPHRARVASRRALSGG